MSLRYFNYLHTIWKAIEMERSISKSDTMQHEEKAAKATEIIRNSVGFAMGAALVPFPGADLVAVSAVQLNMLRQLAKLYNTGFIDTLGRNVISALVGGSAARLGASLVKAIPGVGTVIGELSMPVFSGASTYALGSVVANHFQKGGSLESLDITGAKKVYEQEMESGKSVVDEISKQGPGVKTSTDEAIDKIKKLAELRDEGVLSEEEFARLKDRLLEQI